MWELSKIQIKQPASENPLLHTVTIKINSANTYHKNMNEASFYCQMNSLL